MKKLFLMTSLILGLSFPCLAGDVDNVRTRVYGELEDMFEEWHWSETGLLDRIQYTTREISFTGMKNGKCVDGTKATMTLVLLGPSIPDTVRYQYHEMDVRKEVSKERFMNTVMTMQAEVQYLIITLKRVGDEWEIETEGTGWVGAPLFSSPKRYRDELETDQMEFEGIYDQTFKAHIRQEKRRIRKAGLSPPTGLEGIRSIPYFYDHLTEDVIQDGRGAIGLHDPPLLEINEVAQKYGEVQEIERKVFKTFFETRSYSTGKIVARGLQKPREPVVISTVNLPATREEEAKTSEEREPSPRVPTASVSKAKSNSHRPYRHLLECQQFRVAGDGIVGSIQNRGDKTVRNMVIQIQGFDSQNRVVYEKTVTVVPYGRGQKVMKPGTIVGVRTHEKQIPSSIAKFNVRVHELSLI